MTRLSRRARAAAASGLAIVTFVVAVGAPAHGDPISDKKAKAAAIAAQIEQLGHVVEQYAEQANAAQDQLAQLNAQVAESQKKVAAAQAQMNKHQGELRAYAVDAYIRGGDPSAEGAAGIDDLTIASQRVGYLSAAAGDRQQLIDQLTTTQQDVQARIAQLNESKAEAEAKAKVINEKRAAAAGAVAQQQALKNQVDSELNRLIADEQARQDRIRQAAANARAAAAAAAARVTHSTPAPTQTNYPPVSGNGGAGTAVSVAMAQVGKPYQWGAAGPNSFDCSGLIMYAWGAAGVRLSHYVPSQYSETRHISQSQLQPGDIVYYNGFGHNGMYIGNGQIVHAPHTGSYVQVVSMYYVGNPIAFSRP